MKSEEVGVRGERQEGLHFGRIDQGDFRYETVMPGVSGDQWERSRPGCCGHQRIGLPQAVIDIFHQEAGEAFGNRFVHWDQSMFEKQHPNPMPLCRREAGLRQELFLGYHRVVNPMVGGI